MTFTLESVVSKKNSSTKLTTVKENQTPGFKSAASLLRQATAAAKQSMKLKIDSAIKISALVLTTIDDSNLEKILTLSASLSEDTFLSNVFAPEEMPKLSFLECIVLSGIEARQRPGYKSPSLEGICITKSDLFNVFPMDKRFDREFEQLEKITNGFIKIFKFQHLDQKAGHLIFKAQCDPSKDFSKNFAPA